MNGFQPLLMVKYLTLIKAQGCKTAGCNIKAASIRLTYKMGLHQRTGRENGISVAVSGDEGWGGREWSFVREAL